METQTERVSITIETKRSSIRLHNALYRCLGEPQYVQLLVNPTGKKFCIKSVDSMSASAQPIKVYKPKTPDKNYEIYSCTLVRKLLDELNLPDENLSYRVHGVALTTEHIAIFSFATLENTTEL